MSRPAAPADSQPTTEAPARHDVRRTLLALLASAIGVLPLSELLTDRGWLIDVWLTMLVVVGPAALLRLRRPPSAAQVWIGVALLIPWLTGLFVHAHAFAGVIPLEHTWHDVGRMLTDLHHTTSDEVAPIPSTPAVRLALCALLGLVAALVDLIAVVGRRGALAGVPLLVVFTVAGAVPRKPVSWWLFALAAAAFLILLALDSTDDLHRWGHFVPRPGGALGQARAATSAQRIAVAAIAAAVVLPVFIPSNSRNLIANLFHNGGTSNTGGGFSANATGSISPFAALSGELRRPKTLDLFTVTVHAPQGGPLPTGVRPFYLRTNVLPTFVGDGWTAGSKGSLQDAGSGSFPNSPGTPFQPHTVAFRADFSITHLSSNPPVFADPTGVSGLSADTTWSPQDQLLLGPSVQQGDTFSETIAQPDPTIAQLRAAPPADASLDQWRRLPAIPAYVHKLVDRITHGLTSPYNKARAISDYFSDPANAFSYSLSTVKGDSGNVLVDFLKTRVGFCQQYAAAMAVMLRLADVPSRVVLGYTHDLAGSDGSFTVTTNDAHSWVEAYFSGIGWVPFDPTPLAGIAGGSGSDLIWAPHNSKSKIDPQNPNPGLTGVQRPGSLSPSPSAATGSDAVSATHRHHAARSVPILPIVVALIVVVAVAVLLLTPWLLRRAVRRRRLHRARRGDADALWQELSATATDLGYVWSDARTPRQVYRWLDGPAGPAAPALRIVTQAVEQSRYARPGAVGTRDVDGDGTDAARMIAGFEQVDRQLRSALSPRDRLRARLWPASLRSPLRPGRRASTGSTVRRH